MLPLVRHKVALFALTASAALVLSGCTANTAEQTDTCKDLSSDVLRLVNDGRRYTADGGNTSLDATYQLNEPRDAEAIENDASLDDTSLGTEISNYAQYFEAIGTGGTSTAHDAEHEDPNSPTSICEKLGVYIPTTS
jgi:hypothetical protein